MKTKRFLRTLFIAASLTTLTPLGINALYAADYTEGQEAFDRGDYETARDIWIEAAATFGDPESAAALGRMYASGIGAPADNETAVMWFNAAAERGHLDSQLEVGKRILASKNVSKQDLIKAYKWLKLVEISGDIREKRTRIAKAMRREITKRMSPSDLVAASNLVDAYRPIGPGPMNIDLGDQSQNLSTKTITAPPTSRYE